MDDKETIIAKRKEIEKNKKKVEVYKFLLYIAFFAALCLYSIFCEKQDKSNTIPVPPTTQNELPPVWVQ